MPVTTSYDLTGYREDLRDMVKQLTNEECPMFNDLPRGPKPTAVTHEWPDDTLDDPAENAQVQGVAFSQTVHAGRNRRQNWLQLLKKDISVAGTVQRLSLAGGAAGVSNEFVYQGKKKLKELARDAERAIIVETGNSGGSGAAGRIKGQYVFLTAYGNVITGTSTASEQLTEVMLNDALQACWDDGGLPTDVYGGGYQKRKISGFTTSNQRTMEMKGNKTLVNTVDIYEADFGGKVRIHAHWVLNKVKPGSVLCLNKADWRLCFTMPPKIEKMPIAGDSENGMALTEFTMEALAPSHSAVIDDLATAA